MADTQINWSPDQKFDLAMGFTSKWEGGMVNDKYDRGGKTKYGISQKAHPDIDIENLTPKQAREIYKKEYFDNTGASKLPLPLAMQVFDYAVNSGQGRAVKDLQKVIGVKPDGIIGDKTLDALSKSNQDEILTKYIAARGQNYQRIIQNDPTQERFKEGWYNRLSDLAKSTIPPSR